MAALANRFPHHVKLPDIALRDIAIGMYLPATSSQKREHINNASNLSNRQHLTKKLKRCVLENSRGRAIGFIGPLPLVLVASVVPAHCRSNGTGGCRGGSSVGHGCTSGAKKIEV